MKLTVRRVVDTGPDSDGEYEHIVAVYGSLCSKRVRLPLAGNVATGPGLLEIAHEFAVANGWALGRRREDLADGFAFEVYPMTESPAVADPIEETVAELLKRLKVATEDTRRLYAEASEASNRVDVARRHESEISRLIDALSNIKK